MKGEGLGLKYCSRGTGGHESGELHQCLRRKYPVSLWPSLENTGSTFIDFHVNLPNRWRKEALTFSFHRFKRKLSICYNTLDINRHQVLLIGTQLEYFNSPTYLPREGLSVEEVLRPLAVLAPEV